MLPLGQLLRDLYALLFSLGAIGRYRGIAVDDAQRHLSRPWNASIVARLLVSTAAASARYSQGSTHCPDRTRGRERKCVDTQDCRTPLAGPRPCAPSARQKLDRGRRAVRRGGGRTAATPCATTEGSEGDDSGPSCFCGCQAILPSAWRWANSSLPPASTLAMRYVISSTYPSSQKSHTHILYAICLRSEAGGGRAGARPQCRTAA